MSPDGLRLSQDKMREAGVPAAAIDTFVHLYRQLAAGETGLIADSEIAPLEGVPTVEALPGAERQSLAALDRTVVIKLNGGLGTSMGMTGPKSLLPVRDGLSFLDVIAHQVLALRERHGARLPLVLMNSFYTREASLAALARHPGLEADVPFDFLQNREPKLAVEDLAPVSWPADPELEWCPPGHGDLYTALVTSGMLATLLDAGYEYAFASNADNLGATVDARILGWFAAEELPFLMEVARRTPADRKGGHLARRDDGRLVLREIAQTREEDLDSFQDIERFRWFNTNTLWVNLRALAVALADRGDVLGLPMIRNRKTVDPGDPSSPTVFQLETAMGSAISLFEGARAVLVGRERFAPVKTTNELLGLRSDCYELAADGRMLLTRDGPVVVDLDPGFFRLIGDFDARFAAGPPSLRRCASFRVRGDVSFGAGVVAEGHVEVSAHGDGPVRVPDGAVLQG